MYEDILLPYGGSDGAAAALRHAGELAGWADATLHVLFVADTSRDSVTVVEGQTVDALVREGDEIVEETEYRSEPARQRRREGRSLRARAGRHSQGRRVTVCRGSRVEAVQTAVATAVPGSIRDRTPRWNRASGTEGSDRQSWIRAARRVRPLNPVKQCVTIPRYPV